MGFLTSIFTPAGTNAAGRNTRAQARPQEVAYHAMEGLKPLINSQIGFANQMEPMRQRTLMDVSRLGTSNAMMEASDAFRRNATGGAMSMLPFLRQRLAQGGTGIGAMQGAEASVMNDATRQSNDYFGQLMSPEGRARALQIAMGAYGDMMPGLNPLSSLSSIIYGRPAPTVGPSPLGQILGAAGTYFASQGNGGGGAPPGAVNSAANTAMQGLGF